MSFGKYKGKHVGWVIVENFRYFLWMKDNNMAHYTEYKKMLEYVEILERKPFHCYCTGCKSRNLATRFSIYNNNPIPYYYCDNCDPYESGALPDKLCD